MCGAFKSRAGALILGATLLAAGCGQEATAPVAVGPISLSLVSGDGQSGAVGAELPLPLVVKTTTPTGAPIRDLTVNFRVTSGGGSVFAGSASTSGLGIAQDYWTLGTSTAVSQTLEVRAVIPSSGQKQVLGVFTATALPGPATQIAVQTGDGQAAPAGSNVPIAPAVQVSDQYDNPVPNLVVTFAVATGGGSVSGATPLTGANGIAAVGSWTLGLIAGPNTLTATAAGSGIAGNPVTFTANASGGDFWTGRASMPTPRYSLGVGVVNGKLYAVGGVISSGAAVAIVEAYDPATDTWTTKASLAAPRQGLGVGVVDGKLYAIGGIGPSGFATTVEEYDPATDAWTPKASMPVPLFNLGVAVVNGTLYAVGGINSSSTIVGTVESYDPATDTWTTKASMPTARIEPGVGVLNGTLYAIGGFTSSNVSVATVEAYDPTTDTWTTKASIPAPRYALGVGVVNGALYAVGGANSSSLSGVAAVEQYDPATDTWTSKAPMPTPRWGLGIGALGGRLYAVGGFGTSAFLYLATVEAYQP
jgi:N-acetylneuraminic acid mutarotase